jgi:hypothetical protein
MCSAPRNTDNLLNLHCVSSQPSLASSMTATSVAPLKPLDTSGGCCHLRYHTILSAKTGPRLIDSEQNQVGWSCLHATASQGRGLLPGAPPCRQINLIYVGSNRSKCLSWQMVTTECMPQPHSIEETNLRDIVTNLPITNQRAKGQRPQADTVSVHSVVPLQLLPQPPPMATCAQAYMYKNHWNRRTDTTHASLKTTYRYHQQ